MRSSGLAMGLLLGLVIGAGGMYLALERPWRGGDAAVTELPPDAGAEEAPARAEPKKRRKARRGGGAGGPTKVSVDETRELSDADVRMMWKGDSVEPPATSIDMAAGGEARSLTGSEIQATIARDSGPLRMCIQRALDGAPWEGEVEVVVLVDGEGRPIRTRVHAPTFMFDADLLPCARREARLLAFPEVGGYTRVTIPFPIAF